MKKGFPTADDPGHADRFARGVLRRIENPSAHPILLQLQTIADAGLIGRKRAAASVGLNRNTMATWFTGAARPNIVSVNAVANGLGYFLAAVKLADCDPGVLAEKVRPGALKRVVDPNAHPLVRQLCEIADDLGVSLIRAARMAGVKRTTIMAWWGIRANTPELGSLERVYAVFGYALKLERIAARRSA